MVNFPIPRPDWAAAVHSDISADFLQPLCPALGDNVTLRLRVSRRAPLREVWARFIVNGADTLRRMSLKRSTGHFDWYELSFVMNEARLHWSFVLKDSRQAWFFTRQGLTPYHQTDDYDWVLLADHPLPAWVAGTVFYQIFPDRFAKGGRGTGVPAGSRHFDGHSSKALAWTDRPLSFAEGRCLDFYGGDLDGIRRRLPYLKDLGIGTLFLNPIFCANTIHRYDCTDYFHVDPALGGDKALARLRKACDAAGMRLILDVSINHVGRSHAWFEAALAQPGAPQAEYFYRQPDGSFAYWMGVKTLPQLNYGSPRLRRVMIEGPRSAVKKWLLPPYRIDGWRFDVGNHTARHNADQRGAEVWQAVRQAVKGVNPQAYITGEHWEDTRDYLQGDQWDGAMNYYAAGRPLRRFYGEADRFLFTEDPKAFPAPRSTGFELAAQILQHYGRLPHWHGWAQMNMLDSHDIHRLHNFKTLWSWDLYQAVTGLLWILPGAPNLYYGDEVGLDGWIQDTEGCRFPMEWRKSKQNKAFFKHYQTLNRLKKDREVLATGAFQLLYADETCAAFARYLGREAVVALVHNGGLEREIRLPVAEVLGLEGAPAATLFGAVLKEEKGAWVGRLGPDQGGLYLARVED